MKVSSLKLYVNVKFKSSIERKCICNCSELGFRIRFLSYMRMFSIKSKYVYICMLYNVKVTYCIHIMYTSKYQYIAVKH